MLTQTFVPWDARHQCSEPSIKPRRCPWQCDQMWRNFATLANVKQILVKQLRVYLLLGKILNLIWKFIINFGQIWIVVISQICNEQQSSHLVTLILGKAHIFLFLMLSIFLRYDNNWSFLCAPLSCIFITITEVEIEFQIFGAFLWNFDLLA